MGATAISAPPTDGGFQNQDERSAATRKKLMDGAYQILRRLGHAGLRSANIAEESGVSRGGLLHHYASKELLIAAVCERIFNEMEEESWQRISETSDENILSAIVKDARDRFFDEYVNSRFGPGGHHSPGNISIRNHANARFGGPQFGD